MRPLVEKMRTGWKVCGAWSMSLTCASGGANGLVLLMRCPPEVDAVDCGCTAARSYEVDSGAATPSLEARRETVYAFAPRLRHLRNNRRAARSRESRGPH